MSVLLEKTAEPQIQSRLKPGFHRLMACACTVVLLATLLACKLASLRLPNPLGLTMGLAFVSAVVFTVTICWHACHLPSPVSACITAIPVASG